LRRNRPGCTTGCSRGRNLRVEPLARRPWARRRCGCSGGGRRTSLGSVPLSVSAFRALVYMGRWGRRWERLGGLCGQRCTRSGCSVACRRVRRRALSAPMGTRRVRQTGCCSEKDDLVGLRGLSMYAVVLLQSGPNDRRSKCEMIVPRGWFCFLRCLLWLRAKDSLYKTCLYSSRIIHRL
jgi:hypothetical protein